MPRIRKMIDGVHYSFPEDTTEFIPENANHHKGTLPASVDGGPRTRPLKIKLSEFEFMAIFKQIEGPVSAGCREVLLNHYGVRK